MNRYFAAAIILVGQAAMADPTESRVETVTPDQIEHAKELPQSVVVRIDRKDPTHISVAHLKEKLPLDQKPTDLGFENMAIDSEKVGIAFEVTPKNEKDVMSSTSSWGFGYSRRVRVAYRWGGGAVRWGRGAGYYAGGGYRGGYGTGGGYGVYAAYYPSYQYRGYAYNYAPVSYWQDRHYLYANCYWNQGSGAWY